MQVAVLRNPLVFACRCLIDKGEIRVGMLVFNEGFEPGSHTLYDSSENSYLVDIPALANPYYNAKLTRIWQ